MRPLRLLCFVACVPPVGAMLAKVWGLAQMQDAVVWLALPTSLLVVGIGLWAERAGHGELTDALAIGAAAGLIASVAYDLVRVPFAMSGMRIFGTISAFGVWLLDAPASTRVTELAGWLYHYWNGISFGVMYALAARGRHWAWAIAWACLLETLAILSPFGTAFAIRGDYTAMSIAYLGHVAYGIPLGLMVAHWSQSRAALRGAPPAVWIAMATTAAMLMTAYAFPDDSPGPPQTFVVDGRELHPGWLRLNAGTPITIHNPGQTAVQIRTGRAGTPIDVPASSSITLTWTEPGIVQVAVITDRRSVSSFVMLEPVEAARR